MLGDKVGVQLMTTKICHLWFFIGLAFISVMGCFSNDKPQLWGKLRAEGYMKGGMQYSYSDLPPDHFIVVRTHRDGVQFTLETESSESDLISKPVDENGECTVYVPFAHFTNPDDFIAYIDGQRMVAKRKPRHVLD